MSRRTAAIAVACLLFVLLILAVRNAGEPPAVPEESDPPGLVLVEEFDLPFDGDPLPDSRSLTGRVVHADGTPADGALVTRFGKYAALQREGVPPIRAIDVDPWRVRSGTDGRFSIPGSRWSADMLVRAESEDAASYHTTSTARLEGLDVGDLTLLPALTPEGRVVDTAGDPVAGARVALRFVHGLSPKGTGGEQYLTLADRSDAGGRFRLPPVPRRDDWRVRVDVEHPGYLDSRGDFPLADLLAGGPVRLVMARGLTVTGRLLLPDGAPAAGFAVRVGVRDRRYTLEPLTHTAEDGAFAVRGVPVRDGVVGFKKRPDDIVHQVDVPEGEDGDSRDLGMVPLPLLKWIQGVVIDEDGEGVPGCRVTLRRAGGASDVMSTDTGAEGKFTLWRVPLAEYVVTTRRKLEDGDEIEGRTTGVRPGAEEVAVRVTRAGSLLFVFHAADRPEEPLAVPSYRIAVPSQSWSGAGPVERVRVYPRDAPDEFMVGVKVPGYRRLVIGPFHLLPRWQTRVDVKLTPE